MKTMSCSNKTVTSKAKKYKSKMKQFGHHSFGQGSDMLCQSDSRYLWGSTGCFFTQQKL